MLRTRKYIVVATAAALLAGGVSSANAAAPKKLLGIVSITATDAGNARVIKGATAAAKAAGWTVQVVDAQGNAATANAAISTFVNKKASMIFDLVFPTTSLGGGLAAALKKHVPVATWGGGLGKAVVMTTGDGAPFAGPATKALLNAMGNEGSILALTYRTGQVCRDRETIFNNMLTGKAGITVTKNEVPSQASCKMVLSTQLLGLQDTLPARRSLRSGAAGKTQHLARSLHSSSRAALMSLPMASTDPAQRSRQSKMAA
jgi:ABC-type sugar transport system substrate-binding protein